MPAGDRAVRVLSAGWPRPPAPQVVLLPGLGAIGYMLDLLHAAGAWTGAHLLDLPGFGHPRTADCPAGLDALAAAALGAMPPEPVVLAGHSTGAQLAVRVAAAEPERVGALLLVGPTFPPRLRRPSRLLCGVLATLPYENPGLIRYTAPDYARGRRRVAELLRDALHDRPEERIGGVDCATFLVRGRHDHLCPEDWIEILAARAREARPVTVRGAHNAPFTHPGDVAYVLGEAARNLRSVPTPSVPPPQN